ncbi:hypothetical protein HPB50_010120 [Hyalomma asiaticum]|uniref:Uncharacterized protein n=1 Tax=Hyalomma asiaticum TaxID=266040 RepID=A0ACB7RQ33_HYAAI|nr:hypothetical protein HPB50_010120 [Hyalomma asiaticum]
MLWRSAAARLCAVYMTSDKMRGHHDAYMRVYLVVWYLRALTPIDSSRFLLSGSSASLLSSLSVVTRMALVHHGEQRRCRADNSGEYRNVRRRRVVSKSTFNLSRHLQFYVRGRQGNDEAGVIDVYSGGRVYRASKSAFSPRLPEKPASQMLRKRCKDTSSALEADAKVKESATSPKELKNLATTYNFGTFSPRDEDLVFERAMGSVWKLGKHRARKQRRSVVGTVNDVATKACSTK